MDYNTDQNDFTLLVAATPRAPGEAIPADNTFKIPPAVLTDHLPEMVQTYADLQALLLFVTECSPSSLTLPTEEDQLAAIDWQQKRVMTHITKLWGKV